MLVIEGGENQVIECEGVDGYVGEMEHLVEGVRLGQAPSVSAAAGLSAVEICTAEEESAKTGQIVPVN